jgi:hypothetical protein
MLGKLHFDENLTRMTGTLLQVCPWILVRKEMLQSMFLQEIAPFVR